MKKIISILITFLFPIYIFAYSNQIIVGGESIGIKIDTNGIIVNGFYKVNGEYIAKKTIQMGDIITKINGVSVNNVDEIGKIINKDSLDNNEVDIELIRNGNIINTKLYLEKENHLYKTGIYIKDSIIGLGTLTYIDPKTKIYGALGHEITINETRKIVDVKSGNILSSKVIGIDKSRNGYVGSKNATLSYKNILGSINKNTNKGLYGLYTSNILNNNLYEVATFDEIELGDAYILTVTNNKEIEKYKIKIIDKYKNKKDTQKSFGFEIIDKKLLSKTGGIVQGMSGSPIIQNNKIIGAVTNVIVDNVKLGYGISIITMLEEGDKLLKN